MRLPVNIKILDARHCSINCPLIQFYSCTARGTASDEIEKLEREGQLYLRTEYCKKKAGDYSLVKERCPSCNGTCEGENYLGTTKCTKCKKTFKRVQDQDETYLSEDK